MKRLIAVLLCLALAVLMIPGAAAVEYNLIMKTPLSLCAGGNRLETIAFSASYENNLYVSMRDVASVLSGTEAQFDFGFFSTPVDGDYFAVTQGIPFSGAARGAIEEEDFSLSLYRNRLFVNGQEKKYYSYRCGNPEDIFLTVTDVMLILDLRAERSGSELRFFPGERFTVTIDELEQAGCFETMNSVLVGDAASGKVLYSYRAYNSCPVASTSKLLSCLLIAEAAGRGEISLTDSVIISENAEKLSKSEDGIIKLEAGKAIPLSELLTAMIVASSNESALALAEHLAGSEENFVGLMRRRAAELGLNSAVIYNCNGLPQVSADVFEAKRQNTMNAKDLFTLASVIYREHPEIIEISSMLYARMDALDYTSANSNALVFNVPGVTGLKTGSTKASGQCLVACSSEGKIVIVLGAEDSAIRNRTAELLMRAD